MTNYTSRPAGYGYTSFGASFTYNGGEYVDPNPAKQVLGFESKSGSSVPNWKQLVERRLNASSPYSRSWFDLKQNGFLHVKLKAPPGYFITSSETIGYITTGLDTYFDTEGDNITRDIALSKIKRKIQSDKGDYAAYTDLIQDVAEFRKTIYGTLDSIQNLLRDVQRVIQHGVGSNRRAIVPQLAGLYLAWVFGINPTIQDAKALAAGIESYLKRKDFMKRYQAGHYRDSFNSSRTIFRPNYGLSIDVVESIRRRYYCSYISGHIANLASSNDYGVVKHFHLAPQDFIPALWEWLPWSWLVDYVFTVQPFLEDTFQSEVDTSIYNVEGVKIVKEYRCHTRVIPDAGWTILRNENIDRQWQSGTFIRTPMQNLPGRMLRFHTEYEINKNLGNKLANIIAVMLTRQSRR